MVVVLLTRILRATFCPRVRKRWTDNAVAMVNATDGVASVPVILISGVSTVGGRSVPELFLKEQMQWKPNSLGGQPLLAIIVVNVSPRKRTVSWLASASVTRISTMAKHVNTTNVARVGPVPNAKVVAHARRKMVCVCAKLPGMEPVVRVVKDQRRCAFHAVTRTALQIAGTMGCATRSLASALVKHKTKNSSMVHYAEVHADNMNMFLIGHDHLTSGAGQSAGTIS